MYLMLFTGDSDDEDEGYQYPPFDENLLRRRVGGGYNLDLQGEQGAEGGAMGGAVDGTAEQRDIPA